MLTKYYVFYLANEYLNSIETDSGKPGIPVCIMDAKKHQMVGMEHQSNIYRIYAITTSKQYATMFRKTRNMHCFIEKEIYINEDEIYSFENEMSEFMISQKPFHTVMEVDEGIIRGDLVFPVPQFEYDAISMWGYVDVMDALDEYDMESNGFLSDLVLYDPELQIFKDDFRHLLQVIGFDILVSAAYPVEELPWDDLVSINEFMQYVHVYRKLYKEDGLIKLKEKYAKFIRTSISS